MAERARKSPSVTQQGLELVHAKLKRFSSNKAFADLAGVSRATVQNFLAGKPLRVDSFRTICQTLELDWEEIAGLTTNPTSVGDPQAQENNVDAIAALVQEAWQQIQPYIQQKCGMMRVLDMDQPIGLGDIYTSVNILERITGRRGLDISELTQNADPEQFDRFCLGKVREKRVPGLEAIEKFSKLMILGKPGAGKTTFLKHLAIQCIGGEFQSDRVPIFITLKDFAEADEKPNLLTYIERLLSLGSEGDRPNASSLHNILHAGKVLILLDGLDEIKEADSSRVLRQIREFSERYSQNQFVITCRIAAQDYIFEQFTEVEIADFDDKQINEFANNWFDSKGGALRASQFLTKLKEDSPIRELTSNPLLLTLLCLVYEESSKFPTSRISLYEQGIEQLLRKWNLNRRERDQTYKQLSPDHRADLFSYIAWKTFDIGNYFFLQREVSCLVKEYIRGLPGVSPKHYLKLDSKAVLDSIETQHGILISRARGIYSFSHLAFHEYFTAHYISLNHKLPAHSLIPEKLASHIAEKRWREVILLTAEMLDNADTLLRSVKYYIDKLFVIDKKIQEFLIWTSQKSSSEEFPYKPAGVRAFYFTLTCLFALKIKRDTLAFARSIDPGMPSSIGLATSEPFAPSLDLSFVLLLTLDWSRGYMPDQDVCLLAGLDQACHLTKDSRLSQLLQQLRGQIPIFKKDKGKFEHWWQLHGQSWANQLRTVIVEYCNIGHDWHFDDKQTQLLQQYYYANNLLVTCLNNGCRISQEVRREIEDTLLLPIAEIEKRKQQ
ncbi:NACHT domain-containing NTPase [Trichocoleus sp. FACHB-262]|uniref:NACHT domain-containing protein n=1 Tax=Trichocoleus sp. FACHB-262 TaxID=2692869 RepID=UPI0016896C8F|nr:NACHT domain-containing NTPase [Trichocoleus sp. FACHB-262]MBD2124178.1 NACHT domain-containing NTPase [Trichocoleus sp. FACHB-262]